MLCLKNMFNIRLIDPRSEEEMALVAERMQLTLVDVMGAQKGENYYSKKWILDRLKYHIDLKEKAAVYLALFNHTVAGQAIVRIENDGTCDFGFFSTIYVSPELRQKGLATQLIKEVVEWCTQKHLPYVIYNTASENKKMKNLLFKLGFSQSFEDGEMVQFKLKIEND